MINQQHEESSLVVLFSQQNLSSNDKLETLRKFSCCTILTAESKKQTYLVIVYSTDNFQDKRIHLKLVN